MPDASGKRQSRRAIDRDSVTIFPDESERKGASGDEALFPALPFASCFAYLPGGSGPACEQGRLLCARLKTADPAWLSRLVAEVWFETMGRGHFAGALGGRTVLVPVPGSAPAQGARCVGELLAWCLKEIGLAAEVWPVLRRRWAVRKSAFAPAGGRPSVLQHYASFSVERAVLGGIRLDRRCVTEPSATVLRLTLVDDVITRGRTALAAAGRLHGAFPGAEIRAFALLRTLGPNETLRQVLDPCEGEVRWLSGDARRMP